MSATVASRPARLSDEELVRLLDLVRDADSVELKLTVPEAAHRSALTALQLDPIAAQIRQVFFFDTPDLALNEAGVVVRARRIQGKGGDSAVKLRPVVPSELPAELRSSPAFRVEVDALPGGFVCSGTLKHVPTAEDVLSAAHGIRQVRKLFSKEQRAFYAAHAPAEIALDDLAVLGPIFVLKLRLTPQALARRLVVELWLYPDGSRILELSTRCAPTETFEVAAEVRAYLSRLGLDLTGKQETKTKRALEFFAAEHREQAAASSLAGIVPRWEWRTFGSSADAAARHLAGREPERVQNSDETYLVSARSDASVKVRDDLLDVKELQATDARGLQQWRPVLKASFPVAADDVRSVLAALGVEAPPLEREAYALDQLVREVVEPHDDLAAVQVHKHREHHTVDGAMAEVSVLTTEQGSERTVAVEQTDPDAVVAAVEALGLSTRPNTCLARGLKALAGFPAPRYAVVDVGTNSVKFHLAERGPDGTWTTLADRAEVTRLGEGLQESGRLGGEPIARTVEAIAGMSAEAAAARAAAVVAVGTAGLRIAPNASELVDAVRERTGLEVEVISGEDEARLAYAAAVAGLPVGDGPLVVFDSGGGSSQFTFGRGGGVEEQFSVNVGAARFTEAFGLDGAVDEERLRAAREAIAGDLQRLQGRERPDLLVGLGGTLTNLAAVKHELAAYDPNVVQGTVLDAGEIDRQIELYRTRSADERRELVGLQPKRAEVILAGACIVRTVLEQLGCDAVTVSDRALRHGVLADRFTFTVEQGGTQ